MTSIVGEHRVELQAKPAFSAVFVYTIIPNRMLASNLTLSDNYNTTFEITEGRYLYFLGKTINVHCVLLPI